MTKKIMFNDKFLLTQAVLEGRKTQTRRLIKCRKTFKGEWVAGFNIHIRPSDKKVVGLPCMYDADKYNVGEVVAVAQSYRDCGGLNKDGWPNWDVLYEAVGTDNAGWDNKMFVRADLMPHQIQITNIKIERLQDISDEDCLKEGILHRFTMQDGTKIYHTPHVNGNYDLSTDDIREAFAYLINKTCGKKTWENNPYVFVYEFKLIK